MNYINKIKKEFNNNPDLITKKLDTTLLIYLESLCDSDKINEFILKKDLKNDISYLGSKIIEIDINEYEKYLFSGYTVLIKDKIYAIETKAKLERDVSTNETEISIKGPKNAFIENYQTNLGLIEKRLKSTNLKIINLDVGLLSKNQIGILYLKNKVKKDILNKTIKKLKRINKDIINSSEDLLKYLTNNSLFPTIINTERPDRCTEALSEGKIVIICDGSPSALILPAFLIDFVHPFSDRYNKYSNINFTKILRVFCFFLSVMIPSFYIAIINYNQEAIPTSLIINFASQRSNIPFPSIVECLIMLIICEILRESDLRFPNKYGSAISILGALILGDAAVSAGLVTPIILIITAFTYVASLLFTELDFSNAIRFYRFLFLIISAFFGLYGMMICFIFFIIKLCDTKSFNIPYFYPLAPFNKELFNKYFWHFKRKNK